MAPGNAIDSGEYETLGGILCPCCATPIIIRRTPNGLLAQLGHHDVVMPAWDWAIGMVKEPVG